MKTLYIFFILGILAFSSSKSTKLENVETEILQNFLDEIIKHQEKMEEQKYYDSLGYILLTDPVNNITIIHYVGELNNAIENVDTNRMIEILHTENGVFFEKDSNGYKFQMVVNNKSFSSGLKVFSTIYPNSWLSIIESVEEVTEENIVNTLYLEYFSIRENRLWLSVLNNDSSYRYTYSYLLKDSTNTKKSDKSLRVFNMDK